MIFDVRNTIVGMSDFGTWIVEELDRRGWSRSEAARHGEISPSAIDKIIGGFANPGLDFCRGIARAFNLPLEDVFRKAGILPPSSAKDPAVAALLAKLNNMDPTYRRDAINLAIGIMDYFERRTMTEASKSKRTRQRSGEEVVPTATLREDRLSQFRAAFASLSEEERQQFFEEVARPDAAETQTDGLAP